MQFAAYLGVERQIAVLFMHDERFNCPSNWQLINTPAVRACGRPNSTEGGCSSVIFPVDFYYSRVCGYIIGYQKGTTDAFDHYGGSDYAGLDNAYVDGVSITQGPPGQRTHIWTFASGLYDNGQSLRNMCPCTNANYNVNLIPSFIGSRYFCDTGNHGSDYSDDEIYSQDPLWDGYGCGLDDYCCRFHRPPMFCSQLPQRTNQDIEIRICSDQGTDNEDTLIRDIYLSAEDETNLHGNIVFSKCIA